MIRSLMFFCMIGMISQRAVAFGNETISYLPFKPMVSDTASLQRGAGLFMNYCSGCHSLRYLRYERLAKDLGLLTFTGEVDTDVLKNNLIFTKASVYDPIKISLSPEDARQWFGMVPPDLTLKARERGPQWIYTYLNSFYADATRPFGSNNLLVKDVAMPNVLEPLSGIRTKVYDSAKGKPYLMTIDAGEMNSQAFDAAVGDIVNFLVYASEPVQLKRYRMGFFVMAFFLVFIVIVFYLKRSIWRDID